ncbi:MAG: metalloregulator ArsR/SmtB family transcription factor [Actinomycetota bacterium]|nr:metalloregulator ArsR/SmtB family transcription factor [Actinomycetota bacterium]
MTAQIEEHLPDAWFATAVDLLRAVAVEARLRILWALLHGEHSVNDLADHVGASPSAVSQHLRQLRALGLVATRRQGTFVYYSCDHPHVRSLATEALSHAQHVVAGAPGHHGERTGQASA